MHASRFESEAMPHMNDLFRTAARMAGERAGAEDLVQETYIRAWRSFHAFEPGANCRAWLFKILFCCVRHHRRKLFRSRLAKDELAGGGILAALDKLPAEFRSVVLLVDVEEFAYQEVAGILGIPIGTVVSRLSRGRKVLRGYLAEAVDEYRIEACTESKQGL